MKNKKLIMFLIIIVLVIIVFIIGLYLFKDSNTSNNVLVEYTPEAEITDEQLRNTIVTLYFKNKETLELVPEARSIDAKELLNNPYNTLVTLLIEGPKDEANEKLIPDGTRINNITILENTVYIDFSKEFLNNSLTELEIINLIDSIKNTLLELNEVSNIKILIDGEDINTYGTF